MTNTPETIYLIPNEDPDDYYWCDDPAPDEHCDPAEAVKYVRADVHQAILDRQAKAALMGMDAAKRGAEIMERDAKRMLAESNPDVIDSERAANARLTQELEQAQARVAELEAFVSRLMEPYGAEDVSCEAVEAVMSGRGTEAFILHKQAEAVESAVSGDECPLWFDREYVKVDSLERLAQRLRAEAEKSGGEK